MSHKSEKRCVRARSPAHAYKGAAKKNLVQLELSDAMKDVENAIKTMIKLDAHASMSARRSQCFGYIV